MVRVLLCIVFLTNCGGVFAHGGTVDKDGCHVESATGIQHCDTKRARKAPALPVCDQPAPKPGDDNVLYGRVTKIVDGDTFKVKIQGVVMTFRLSDIDAPEHDQPFGPEAKKILDDAIDGDEVVMLNVDQDSYGRVVVHVWLGDVYVNREMVAQGAAWYYAEYARGDCLYEIEQEASKAKRGFWALPLAKRQKPWDWRRAKRDSAPPKRKNKVAGK